VVRRGRAGAFVAGLAIAGVWIVGAIVSARLSPAARAPLLDGILPIQSYRWVDPPPALADTNRQPFGATADIRLGANGSESTVLTTADGQVNVFFDAGTFANAPKQTAVHAEIEPLAPSTVAAPPGNLTVLGNVYRLTFTYVPSGDTIRSPATPFQVLLVYPSTPGGSTTGHHVAWTKDGTTWVTKLRGSNLAGTQQSFARVESPGYVAVLGTPSALPTGNAGGGSRTLQLLVVVLAGASALLAVAWYVLGVRRDRALLATLEDDEDEGDSPG
jgi:hypothetical protein